MSDRPNLAGGDKPRMPDGHARPAAARVGDDAAVALRAEFLGLLGASRSSLWLVAAAVTGDRTEADDVLQDAAMIGLAKFSDFTPGSSFDAWMGQITRNVALNALRKRKRAAAVLTDQSHSPELRVVSRVNNDDGEDGRRESEAGKAEGLAAAVAGLDDVARTCLLLRVVGELPYQAIAAIVQVPESTAMSHVYRSRGHLRNWLLKAEGQSEGGGRRLAEASASSGKQQTSSPPTPRTGVAQ